MSTLGVGSITGDGSRDRAVPYRQSALVGYIYNPEDDQLWEWPHVRDEVIGR
jgi:hypothetical protein